MFVCSPRFEAVSPGSDPTVTHEKDPHDHLVDWSLSILTNLELLSLFAEYLLDTILRTTDFKSQKVRFLWFAHVLRRAESLVFLQNLLDRGFQLFFRAEFSCVTICPF